MGLHDQLVEHRRVHAQHGGAGMGDGGVATRLMVRDGVACDKRVGLERLRGSIRGEQGQLA